MKAIFHIGHHKTGTTSLQAFLAVNNRNLLRAGVLSPWVESQGAVWAVAQSLTDDEVDAEFLPINIREPHNALAFRMLAEAVPERKVPPYHRGLPASGQMLIAIRNQAELLMPETMVFCSEVMSHFGPTAPDLISRLADALGEAEFGLHITLRRPDDQLIAWHGQQLRFGRKVPPLTGLDAAALARNLNFDVRAVIEPWITRLPGVEMRIRPYRETLAAGGSIPDFFGQWNLPYGEDLREVSNLNPGLPRSAFALQRLANAALPPPAAKTFASDLAEIAPDLDLPAAGDIEFFGSTVRSLLTDEFAPIHAWLNEITGRAAFFEDLDDMARLRPVSEGEALRQLLDQLEPKEFDREARSFVSELGESFSPDQLP